MSIDPRDERLVRRIADLYATGPSLTGGKA
jgi:hypothetical protein